MILNTSCWCFSSFSRACCASVSIASTKSEIVQVATIKATFYDVKAVGLQVIGMCANPAVDFNSVSAGGGA